MLKFEIISPELKKSRELDALEDTYKERLSRYAKINYSEIKPVKGKNLSVSDIKQKEGEALLSLTKQQSCLIALTENGKNLSSEELTSLISKNANSGSSLFQFIIGGPYGLSKPVLDKSQHVISLSKMTFTARIASFILVEQLYRSIQIINGHPYHKP